MPSNSSSSGLTSHTFHGNVIINTSTAKKHMAQIAEEIIAVLTKEPKTEVSVTLEIQAKFPSSTSEQTKRAVKETAQALNFKNADWEWK